MSDVCRLPIYIDDTAARTVWQIRGECRRLKAEGQLDRAVIDYVQLMSADKPSPSGNRNAEITEISRATSK